MKIQIESHIPEAGHYPGQILIDHPCEQEWVDDGRAKALPDDDESEIETADVAEVENAAGRPAKRRRRK